MKKLENIDQFMESMSDYSPSFSEGFADRVIQKIDSGKSYNEDSYPEFVSLFRWIALSGVAAIIILLFTVYLTEGSMDTDALFGVFNYSPDNPELASLNY